MLQWMGGSRRKVTSSRKSTHNRQRQYFEQRKRQQQTHGLDSDTDVRKKRTHSHEETRSLDILGLISLTTVAQQDCSIHGADLDVSQENSHLSRCSPPIMLKNTCGHSNNLEEACFEHGAVPLKKLCAPPAQNVPTSHKSGVNLDGRDTLDSRSKDQSNNSHTKLNERTEEAQNDVSVLDLLIDDGPKNHPRGRSIPEAHVAFSVAGLGKVEVRTPAQSPRLYARCFPPTPKASRRIQPSGRFKSIPGDIRLDLSPSMYDIKVLEEQSPSELKFDSRDIYDDLNYTENAKFIVSCMNPDTCEALTKNSNDEEKFFSTHKGGHEEQQWNARFGVLDENILDEIKYDALGKSESFYKKNHSSFPPERRKSEPSVKTMGGPFSQESRNAFKANQTADVSGMYDRGKDTCINFEWERFHGKNESMNCNDIFHMPSWSFCTTAISQDNMNLLSGELCSSTSVGEDKSYDFSSHSMKPSYSKINPIDKHHAQYQNKNDAGFFSSGGTLCKDLDEISWENDLVGMENYGNIPEHWPSRPECISLFQEEHTSIKVDSSPSYRQRTSAKINSGLFDYPLIPENNLFYLLSFPEMSQTTTFKNNNLKFKTPAEHGTSVNFTDETDILRQLSDPCLQSRKDPKHPLEMKDQSPYSYYAAEFPREAIFPELSGQHKVEKDGKDEYKAAEEPQDGDSTEKRSLSSVNSGTAVAVDSKSSCNKNEESNAENDELFDAQKSSKLSHKAQETPVAMEKTSMQPSDCTGNQIDHCTGRSPVPPQIKKLTKDKSKCTKKSGKRGDCNTDTSYQEGMLAAGPTRCTKLSVCETTDWRACCKSGDGGPVTSMVVFSLDSPEMSFTSTSNAHSNLSFACGL